MLEIDQYNDVKVNTLWKLLTRYTTFLGYRKDLWPIIIEGAELPFPIEVPVF